MWCDKGTARAFALYEVLLGLSIFVIGVLMLGRSVQNCLNASTLSSEEDRVRQILSNRMAEIQATPGFPDTQQGNKNRHRLRRSEADSKVRAGGLAG